MKLGDFIRIDMTGESHMTFVKEAEGAMVPVLLERYGAVSAQPAAARAVKTVNARREFGANPGLAETNNPFDSQIKKGRRKRRPFCFTKVCFF